jgi:pimeloyl-ACP methyl ester carboxylesterase
MLHWLGGSSHSWTEVSEGLATRGIHCAAVDLPGFGNSAGMLDFSIASMAHALTATIRALRTNHPNRPWLLAGHSMGGKLTAILARFAADGVEGLEDLRGVILLSPSPPGPEPMDESKRTEMLNSLGHLTPNPRRNRTHAESFLDDNTGRLPLHESVRNRSVDDVLRMNPGALTAWLLTGSKEDWSRHVGTLAVPTLILAGTEEKALGPDAQETHTLPHFTNAKLVPLEGCGHLAPLERPGEVIARMLVFLQDLGLVEQPTTPQLGTKLLVLLASDRTSPQTRAVLVERLRDNPAATGILTSEELLILHALVERIIPNAPFDLVSRIDHALAQNPRDGWRFNTLPPDQEAWQQGLHSLDIAARKIFAVPFLALDADRIDDLLRRAQTGDLGAGLLASLHRGDRPATYDASQMRDWFEDVRAEIVKIYFADPRTMERIDFTGFADDQGFTHIQLGEQQEKEL